MTDRQAVAQTILEQMGGTRKLEAMVRARHFMALEGDGGLQFTFSGSKKANVCRIAYDAGRDLYTFELGKFSNLTYTRTFIIEGVYWDLLAELFEKHTGLYLTI